MVSPSDQIPSGWMPVPVSPVKSWAGLRAKGTASGSGSGMGSGVGVEVGAGAGASQYGMLRLKKSWAGTLFRPSGMHSV